MWSIIIVVIGVVLLFIPAIAWKFGWGTSGKPMPRWYSIVSRVAGIVVIGLGVFFIVIEINTTALSPASSALFSASPPETSVPAPTSTPVIGAQPSHTLLQPSATNAGPVSNTPFNEQGFLFAESSKQYLTSDEIWNQIDETLKLTNNTYSRDELLGFARNEIFARHGNLFDTPKYANHYNQYDWYARIDELHKVDYSELNEYETANIALLLECEEMSGDKQMPESTPAPTKQAKYNNKEQRQQRIAKLEQQLQMLHEEMEAAQALFDSKMEIAGQTEDAAEAARLRDEALAEMDAVYTRLDPIAARIEVELYELKGYPDI